MSRRWAYLGALALGVLAVSGAPGLWAAPQQPPQEQPCYATAEFDALRLEKNAQQRAKLVEEFVVKSPTSCLLPYVYQVAYATYRELKNFPKMVDSVDKLSSFGDKVETPIRLDALYFRAQVFEFIYNAKDPNAREHLTRSLESARSGIQVLNKWTKPPELTDEQYATAKKQIAVQFHNTSGFSALQLKDYRLAVTELKESVKVEPNQPAAYYRMGIAYLQSDPPQQLDGFWAVARAIALKIPNDPQVRAYLRRQMLQYQETVCEKQIDAQMNELMALAATEKDRPAEWRIPSAADLQKARETIGTNFLADLRAGGETAKVMWLASCGLEFPEVGGKVLEVVEGNDSVTLKLFAGATQEETEAGTTPNMEVKVVGQPEASRVLKDSGVRFAGTLVDYTPNPFLLRWDKAKVNAEDIPEAKPEPPAKKAPAKRPAKRPAKKQAGR